MFRGSSSNQPWWRGPPEWSLSLLLLVGVQLFAWLLLTDASAVIARWPALDYKSDRAFYPLMVSFSRYPFHDVYETGTGVGHAPPARHPVPPSVCPASRPNFPKLRKQGWQQVNARTSTKAVCQGLIYLPQQLEASGRRMLPPKMRKLLKYCGFI